MPAVQETILEKTGKRYRYAVAKALRHLQPEAWLSQLGF
jgi:hypothetical protein